MAEADVKLTFGVQTVSTKTQIKTDLDGISTNLDPFKIKIEVDPSSYTSITKTLKSEVEKALQSVSGANLFKDSGTGSSTTSNVTAKVQDMTRAITQVNNELAKVDTEFYKVQGYVGAKAERYSASLEQIGSSLRVLLNDLKDGSVTMEQFKTRFDNIKLSISDMNLKVVDSGTKSYFEELAVGTEKYSSALSKAVSLRESMANMQANIVSGKVFASEEDVEKLNVYIELINDLIERLNGMPKGVFNDTFSDISSSYKVLSENIDGYDAKLQSIKALTEQVQNAQAKISEGKATGDTTALENYIKGLEQLRTDMDTISTQEFWERFAKLNTDISATTSNMESVSSATKKLQSGTTEYNNALKQLITLENQVKSTQDKITNGKAIASDSDKASLDQYVQTLEKLKSELESGELSVEDFKRRLSAVSVQFKETSGNVKTVNTHLKDLQTAFVNMFSATRILSAIVSSMKKMVNTAIELDDAMTQLQIVTNSSDSTMAEYSQTIAESAKEMSASIADLIESSTTYARLGYNLDESNTLAKYTAMLQNVADVDVSTAQDAVTSIIKAFDLDASDIVSVMDKMVEVGNNFPISAAQIAEGMNNVSSVMASAGNSVDQTIALLTAANTTVQDISKSSTGLRTIAARLRNTTTELDELGEEMTEAQYEELIDALTDGGVALTDLNGDFRSTYDILQDLASVWDSLSSMDQAAIAKNLAGTRQQNILYSLINQFQEASSAMDSMADSSGALTDAYDTFQESITAHINTFKAAFQDLSQSTVTRDFINDIIDSGTRLLEVLTPVLELIMNIVDTLGVIPTLGIGTGIAALVKNFG